MRDELGEPLRFAAELQDPDKPKQPEGPNRAKIYTRGDVERLVGHQFEEANETR